MKLKKIITIFAICLLAATMITAVSASEKITATTDAKFTHHSPDSAPGKAGYTFDVDVGDGDAYYFTVGQEVKMAEYSSLFALAWQWDYDTNYDHHDVDIKNVFGNTVGYLDVEDSANQLFSFGVDKEFSFTYTGGHQVGLNDDAKQIEHIYDENGKQLC